MHMDNQKSTHLLFSINMSNPSINCRSSIWHFGSYGYYLNHKVTLVQQRDIYFIV